MAEEVTFDVAFPESDVSVVAVATAVRSSRAVREGDVVALILPVGASTPRTVVVLSSTVSGVVAVVGSS